MKTRNAGFTLIEVAMVMVIIGLILAASITPLSNQIERSKIQETNLILNDVMEALYGFAAANGRLPCPADAQSLGQELNNGSICTVTNASMANGAHGFVPGRTLGLTGGYNADELLLDAWDNPIRYSVTQADNDTIIATPGIPATSNNVSDFTSNNEIRAVGTVSMNDLLPDLFICSRYSTSGTDCLPAPPTNNTLADNAVAVVMSLGKHGNDIPAGNDERENAFGPITLAAAAPPAGTGQTYQINNNRVFVSHDYKNTTSGAGFFNDQIIWMSPFTLYDRMYKSNALP